MASNRIFRINEDIKFVLSDLLRNIKDPRIRYCKVYLSVYGLKSEKEMKKGLKSASGWLRHELGQKLDLRYTPELVFELDKSIEHGAHISQIMNELEAKESGAKESGDGDEEDNKD